MTCEFEETNTVNTSLAGNKPIAAKFFCCKLRSRVEEIDSFDPKIQCVSAAFWFCADPSGRAQVERDVGECTSDCAAASNDQHPSVSLPMLFNCRSLGVGARFSFPCARTY